MSLITFPPLTSPMRTSATAGWFDTRLPLGLRRDGDELSWDEFVAVYSPSSGPVRLRHWACTDVERPAGRLGPQPRNYRATLAVGDRIGTSTAAAVGPVAALTAMLHDHGIALEIKGFHQLRVGERTATFISGCDGLHAEWAMGLAHDGTQSALRGVIACANRLRAAGAAR